MAVDQALERPVDHPGDPRLGPTSAQGRKDGERVDDVTQGTGLDQADAPGTQGLEVVERGRHDRGNSLSRVPSNGHNVTQSPPGDNAGCLGLHPAATVLEALDDRPCILHTLAPELGVIERGEAEFRPTAAEADVPERFRLGPAVFAYELEPLRTRAVHSRSSAVRFPSPFVSPDPVNNTVHAEYFRPIGPGPSGRRPAVIVLHILGADFALSRYMAARLADRGVAALFVKLPYYGERRPPRRAQAVPLGRHRPVDRRDASGHLRRPPAPRPGSPAGPRSIPPGSGSRGSASAGSSLRWRRPSIRP